MQTINTQPQEDRGLKTARENEGLYQFKANGSFYRLRSFLFGGAGDTDQGKFNEHRFDGRNRPDAFVMVGLDSLWSGTFSPYYSELPVIHRNLYGAPVSSDLIDVDYNISGSGSRRREVFHLKATGANTRQIWRAQFGEVLYGRFKIRSYSGDVMRNQDGGAFSGSITGHCNDILDYNAEAPGSVAQNARFRVQATNVSGALVVSYKLPGSNTVRSVTMAIGDSAPATKAKFEAFGDGVTVNVVGTITAASGEVHRLTATNAAGNAIIYGDVTVTPGMAASALQTAIQNKGGTFAARTVGGVGIAGSAEAIALQSSTLPRAFSQAAVCAGADGKIYVLGGVEQNVGYFTTIYAYNPGNDTWATKTATVPYGEAGRGSALAANGKIYLFGGNHSGDVATIAEYTPSTDTIVTKTAVLPVATGDLENACVAVGSKIYVVGIKATSGGTQNRIYEYDTVNDTLTAQTAVLPQGLAGITAANVGGKIYIFGGRNTSNVPQGAIYVYDPALDTISTKGAVLDTAVSQAGVSVSGTRIYLFNGVLGNGQGGDVGINKIQIYDTVADTLALSTSVTPQSLFRSTVGTVAGIAYILGGDVAGGSTNKNYKFTQGVVGEGTYTISVPSGTGDVPDITATPGTGWSTTSTQPGNVGGTVTVEFTSPANSHVTLTKTSGHVGYSISEIQAGSDGTGPVYLPASPPVESKNVLLLMADSWEQLEAVGLDDDNAEEILIGTLGHTWSSGDSTNAVWTENRSVAPSNWTSTGEEIALGVTVWKGPQSEALRALQDGCTTGRKYFREHYRCGEWQWVKEGVYSRNEVQGKGADNELPTRTTPFMLVDDALSSYRVTIIGPASDYFIP